MTDKNAFLEEVEARHKLLLQAIEQQLREAREAYRTEVNEEDAGEPNVPTLRHGLFERSVQVITFNSMLAFGTDNGPLELPVDQAPAHAVRDTRALFLGYFRSLALVMEIEKISHLEGMAWFTSAMRLVDDMRKARARGAQRRLQEELRRRQLEQAEEDRE
jgi:hypothetical protein